MTRVPGSPLALLHRMLAPAGAILAYHGVSTPAVPAGGVVHVDRDRLLEDLDALAAEFEIVPLRALLARHRAGTRTAGMLALTFDDAYASLSSLRPGLRARGIPVTVFATTGLPEGASFWWDRIDDLHPRVDPGRWREFEREIGVSDDYRDGQPADHGPLRPLRQWLLAEHAGRWPSRLESPLLRLEEEIGYRTMQRPMRSSELEEFADDPLIDVGIHTRTHPVLPLLRPAELVSEVRDCLRDLRERIPKTIPVLAAPFGLFDDRSAALAHEAGADFVLGLGDRTLAAPFAGDVLPRFSMSRSLSPWKVRVRATGLPERMARLTGSGTSMHPPLPSPTT